MKKHFNTNAFQHCRYTKTVYEEGTLIERSALKQIIQDNDDEGYISHFSFPNEAQEYFASNKNKKGNNSMSGYSGPCYATYLYIDIDNDDLKESINHSQRIIRYLLSLGFTIDDILLWFSGKKGFHIGVPISPWGLVPNSQFNDECKALALYIAKQANVKIDTSIYDKVRLFRLPYSKHPKSGLYKIPISVDDVLKHKITTELLYDKASKRPSLISLPQPPKCLLDLKKITSEILNSPKTNSDYQQSATKQSGWLSDALQSLQAGNRHSTFVKIAGKMWKDKYEQEDIIEILKPHAESVDYPFDELEKDVTDVCQRYPRNSTSPLSIYSNGDVEEFKPIQLSTSKEPPKRVYLIEHLVPKNHITNMFGDGGSCKTYFAMIMGFCVALGKPFLDFYTKQANVLFLDWELNAEDHTRRAYEIARGMKLTKPCEGMYYVSLIAPLEQQISKIKKFIDEYDIGLVIIDSMGLACGNDPDSAHNIFKVVQAINCLKKTVIVIDHQSKLQQGQNYQNKTAFGSVYKSNLSRSVMQFQRISSANDNEVKLKIRPTKHNFGPLLDEIGVLLQFNKDPKSVTFERLDPKDDADFYHTLKTDEQVLINLENDGPGTCKELSARTGIKQSTLTNLLTKLKGDKKVVIIDKDKNAPIYDISSNQITNESQDSSLTASNDNTDKYQIDSIDKAKNDLGVSKEELENMKEILLNS